MKVINILAILAIGLIALGRYVFQNYFGKTKRHPPSNLQPQSRNKVILDNSFSLSSHPSLPDKITYIELLNKQHNIYVQSMHRLFEIINRHYLTIKSYQLNAFENNVLVQINKILDDYVKNWDTDNKITFTAPSGVSIDNTNLVAIVNIIKQSMIESEAIKYEHYFTQLKQFLRTENTFNLKSTKAKFDTLSTLGFTNQTIPTINEIEYTYTESEKPFTITVKKSNI